MILGNVEIVRVHETKVLGVIINDNICWTTHIKHVKPK